MTKLQILSAFPFINVTFKAPLAQVNHNYISKGLWYHSKSSDSQSCQWKASCSVSLSLSLSLSHTHTHTHTHTGCTPFPLLFFFSAWFLNEAITLSFFPATASSFPFPGRPRRTQGKRVGFSTNHSSQRKWQGCDRKPGLDRRPASGPVGEIFRDQDVRAKSSLHYCHFHSFPESQVRSDGSFFLYIFSGFPSFMAVYLANMKR